METVLIDPNIGQNAEKGVENLRGSQLLLRWFSETFCLEERPRIILSRFSIFIFPLTPEPHL